MSNDFSTDGPVTEWSGHGRAPTRRGAYTRAATAAVVFYLAVFGAAVLAVGLYRYIR